MQSNFPKTPFFLSIMLFIFSCFLFFFSYQAINKNNEAYQLKEKEWQTETFRRDEIKALDYSVKIIEGERAQLETHFAQSSDIVPFLDTIEELAPKVNTKAEVTSVEILKDHSGLLVGMKASGSFTSLYKFLTLLENSQYELEFIGMDIHQGTEANSESKNVKAYNWSAVFTIRLLSFIE